jgi:hypothetical protein
MRVSEFLKARDVSTAMKRCNQVWLLASEEKQDDIHILWCFGAVSSVRAGIALQEEQPLALTLFPTPTWILFSVYFFEQVADRVHGVDDNKPHVWSEMATSLHFLAKFIEHPNMFSTYFSVLLPVTSSAQADALIYYEKALEAYESGLRAGARINMEGYQEVVAKVASLKSTS